MLEKKSEKELRNNNGGITLIALVVTIIVLLILAGVTISLVVGQNGIITRARQAQEAQEVAEERERIQMEIVDLEAGSLQNGRTLTIGEITTRIVDEKKLATSVNGTTGEIITAKGHSITDLLDEFLGSSTETGKWSTPYIPTGFEHTVGEWDSGYVIKETATGNEFVWIPVGCTINGTKIELKRTYFDRELYTEEWAQTNFGSDLTTFLTNAFGLSTVDEVEAKFHENLDSDFANSVATNGGYYIARYEASYGSGSTASDYIPLSKVSTATRTSSSTALAPGMLWNYINQTEARAASENMYKNNSEIASMLMSSYAWDTALTFLKAKGYNVATDSSSWGNYAETNGSGTLANTGVTTKAVACNIYDLAGNLAEWTTEQYDTNGVAVRGGFYGNTGSDFPAGVRGIISPDVYVDDYGFRSALYKR